MSEKGEKIIVIRERGSGCLVKLFLLVAFVIAFGLYLVRKDDIDDSSPSPRSSSQKADDPSAPPSQLILNFTIDKAVRQYFNDPSSYSPIKTIYARHPDGYFFIHECRAKNAFGALIKSEFGLLYSTNNQSWTYCDHDALASILPKITSDPSLKAKMQ
ncbi:MAG: hypothetical protein IJQ34_02050 [Kiritimatiellae bacterium]|nr:hypothetical protein [Kiritimatiellia bacterium]